MNEIQTQRPYWDGDPTSLAPLWGGVIDFKDRLPFGGIFII